MCEHTFHTYPALTFLHPCSTSSQIHTQYPCLSSLSNQFCGPHPQVKDPPSPAILVSLSDQLSLPLFGFVVNQWSVWGGLAEGVSCNRHLDLSNANILPLFLYFRQKFGFWSLLAFLWLLYRSTYLNILEERVFANKGKTAACCQKVLSVHLRTWQIKVNSFLCGTSMQDEFNQDFSRWTQNNSAFGSPTRILPHAGRTSAKLPPWNIQAKKLRVLSCLTELETKVNCLVCALESKKKTTVLVLYYKLWTTMTITKFSGRPDILQRSASRFFMSCYWFLTITVTAIFIGNLTAFMTIKKIQLPINSLEELASHPEFQAGLLSETAVFDSCKVTQESIALKGQISGPGYVFSNISFVAGCFPTFFGVTAAVFGPQTLVE